MNKRTFIIAALVACTTAAYGQASDGTTAYKTANQSVAKAQWHQSWAAHQYQIADYTNSAWNYREASTLYQRAAVQFQFAWRQMAQTAAVIGMDADRLPLYRPAIQGEEDANNAARAAQEAAREAERERERRRMKEK
jgi:hypothetical protein